MNLATKANGRPMIDRIGKNVRHYRRLKELSQADLARQVGCSAQHIHAIETGVTPGSVIKLCAICDALNIDFAILMSEPVWTGEEDDE